MIKKYSKYYIYFSVGILLLIAITGIVYIIGAKNLGYYAHDWDIITSAISEGKGSLLFQFAEISPLTGILYKSAFSNFGTNPYPYYLCSLLCRLFSGFFLWVTLFIIWPTERTAAFSVSLYFLIFPGFLQQPSGITYLPLQIALLCYVLSICLMTSAFFLKNKNIKIIFMILSIGLTVFELLIMKSFIGLEVFRLLLIFFYLYLHTLIKPAKKFTVTAIYYLPWFVAILILFFCGNFNSTSLTNVENVIGNYASPITSQGLNFFSMISELIRNTGKNLFGAWAVPTYNTFNTLNMNNFWPVMIKAITCTALYFVLVLVYWNLNGPVVAEHDIPEDCEKSKGYKYKNGLFKLPWQAQWIIMGFVSLIFSLLPFVISGRSIQFNDIQDWIAFPGGMFSCIIICGLIFQLRVRYIEWIMMVLMVGIGTITQIANMQIYADKWKKNYESIERVETCELFEKSSKTFSTGVNFEDDVLWFYNSYCK